MTRRGKARSALFLWDRWEKPFEYRRIIGSQAAFDVPWDATQGAVTPHERLGQRLKSQGDGRCRQGSTCAVSCTLRDCWLNGEVRAGA